MQEDFLHYVWNYKKFDFLKARTVSNLPITILSTGTQNTNSGPDFFNSKLQIGDQLWAGNVEIHIKSSDWYAHNHEKDSNYDNVILHVVWQDDVEIFRKDNTPIPTMELRTLVPATSLQKYRNLVMGELQWINCEKEFPNFQDFEVSNWLERLFIERLEKKSEDILSLLQQTKNNWEAVLFIMLSKGFGLNINGAAFKNMAQNLDFSIVQKSASSQFKLESLLFGQSGFLEKHIEEEYFHKLKEEYDFLSQKFKLNNEHIETPKFFRLRPDNFPNIRLSQLAMLYSKSHNLFEDLIIEDKVEKIYDRFRIEPSNFWRSHYTFNKEHAAKPKFLTKSFIELLIINTIVPLKFCYQQQMGMDKLSHILDLLEQIPAEKNEIIKKYNTIRPKTAGNALLSQGLIQLKREYCDKNACLKCRLGLQLLQGE